MLETFKRDQSQRYDEPIQEMGGEGSEICGFKVISDEGEKIGKVDDYVIDDNGRLRYVVVDYGNWFTGKRVLVPVGMLHIDDANREVVIRGLSKEQVKSMPDYDESHMSDEEYESTVLGSYYPESRRKGEFASEPINYDQYDKFQAPERIRLLEERLNVDKRREKVGDVHVRKTVDTHMERIDVPVTEEHLVIERHPVSGETDITQGRRGDFEGERGEWYEGERGQSQTDVLGEDTSIDIPLYKEDVEVTKRPVASEEVTLRKEARTENRVVEEQVQRERLDVDNPGDIDIEDQNDYR